MSRRGDARRSVPCLKQNSACYPAIPSLSGYLQLSDEAVVYTQTGAQTVECGRTHSPDGIGSQRALRPSPTPPSLSKSIPTVPRCCV